MKKNIIMMCLAIICAAGTCLAQELNPKHFELKQKLEYLQKQHSEALQAFDYFLRKEGKPSAAIKQSAESLERQIREVEYYLSQEPMYK